MPYFRNPEAQIQVKVSACILYSYGVIMQVLQSSISSQVAHSVLQFSHSLVTLSSYYPLGQAGTH